MSDFPKAKIEIYKDDAGKAKSFSGKAGSHEFQFNPEAVRVTKSMTPKQGRQAGRSAPKHQFTTGNPAQLEFGELLFDCFDDRKNVYTEHVAWFELLLKADPGLHRPPRVTFAWGDGWGSEGGAGKINTGMWFVTGLDVNYTMFLPNGTPVRATCKLTLAEEPPETEEKNSPDTAHVHAVSRGETLEAISAAEYDDPAEWRRIAVANGIDDPLRLAPGQRLLIPPILR
ncbi:MAG: LysM peptidoglycan-binding domain-containing protein [Deltaproteobacteria bacterium]|nr:LysM peptidoglycan-binding domain-containing protein [Deltaproteobacteria bacterium]